MASCSDDGKVVIAPEFLSEYADSAAAPAPAAKDDDTGSSVADGRAQGIGTSKRKNGGGGSKIKESMSASHGTEGETTDVPTGDELSDLTDVDSDPEENQIKLSAGRCQRKPNHSGIG